MERGVRGPEESEREKKYDKQVVLIQLTRKGFETF